MLAAHNDQENLVSMRQAAASTKQQNQRSLQPKTPGARFPKTPLKVPLNDENAVRGLGGKSILTTKAKADKAQWVTPAEPRTGRAVLGDKTTNAKARNNQTANGKNTGVRDADKSQPRPTAARPHPLASKPESQKIQILLDNYGPLSEDVDTNPAPPPALPYESDVFPNGILTFEGIKPENRLKGYYDYYHNRRDENGMTRLDREMKAAQEKRFRDGDAKIRKDLDEMTWDLGLESPKKRAPPATEIPGKRLVRAGAAVKAPSTMASRRAASALGMAPKPSVTNLQRKPQATNPAPTNPGRLPSFMQPTKARQTTSLATRPKIPSLATTSATATTTSSIAASRSTLGYSKGRSVSSAVHSGHVRSMSEAPARALSRSNTTASGSSDVTITPATYAKDSATPKPDFVSIFDKTPASTGAHCVLLSDPVDDGALYGTKDTVDSLGAGEPEDEDFCLELNI